MKKSYWILLICWAILGYSTLIVWFLQSKNSEDVSLDCKIYRKGEKLVIICRGECDDVISKGNKYQCKKYAEKK